MRTPKKIAVAGLLAAVPFVVGQASAATQAATSMHCSLHAQLKSGQISEQGVLIGSVSCGQPFGKGSYDGRYRDHVNPSPFTGGETGSSKFSLKAGSVLGRYAVSQAPIAGTAPWRGKFHITGGSGQFKHARGTLNMTCAHWIPALTDCTLSGPVRGV
jgi:hypothetical protein